MGAARMCRSSRRAKHGFPRLSWRFRSASGTAPGTERGNMVTRKGGNVRSGWIRPLECPARRWARLPGEAIEHGRHREGGLRRGHFRCRIRARGLPCFASGIPTAIEGRHLRTPVCSLASCPPTAESLPASCTAAGMADIHMGTPNRCLSMRSHDHLPLKCSHHLLSAVVSIHRSIHKIPCRHRTIQ